MQTTQEPRVSTSSHAEESEVISTDYHQDLLEMSSFAQSKKVSKNSERKFIPLLSFVREDLGTELMEHSFTVKTMQELSLTIKDKQKEVQSQVQ